MPRNAPRSGALSALVCLAAAAASAFPPGIVEKPISFSPARVEATRLYLKDHYGIDDPDISIQPRMVILHWTGTESFGAAWNTFNPETLAKERKDIAGGGSLNVSAHFLVDRDGTIYRLMPEDRMARHAIGLNWCAVGVENVGGAGGKDDLTEDQAEADAWLVRRLKARFPGIRYLIGHNEYLRFAGTPLWKERDPKYRTVKQDPGERFMREVRARVADLDLKGAP